MAAAGRNAESPSEYIPYDSADQGTEHDHWIDDFGIDHAAADRGGHVQTEHREGDEVEEGGPEHGGQRPQHPGRNDRCDRVGTVVQPVEEIEQQRHSDEADQHRRADEETAQPQTCSTTMASITSTTSSHRSTTASTRS
jgi:hypothetical protein